ncbi:MAG TPA: class I SAM-dependent methyltransferase [Candidatus Paceibacterota bacterium]|nr:class I SAM-dependent methyltransferase [Candidatus Paceibacterota bacterium]
MNKEKISNEELKEMTNGERLYPEFMYDHSRSDHESRYVFAQKYVKEFNHVLDAACGSGYGSKILSHSAQHVTGIDLSRHAISYAQEHFGNSSINFRVGDLGKKFEFSDDSFDAIVSFETLEHVVDQDFMLKEFKRVLKPGGVLVISTPDKNIHKYVDPGNPYHIKELTKEEFITTLSKYFKVFELYGKDPLLSLPIYYKFLRMLVKIWIRLDVIKLGRSIVPRHIKQKLIKNTETTSEHGNTYPLDIEAPNIKYDDLIAICIAS